MIGAAILSVAACSSDSASAGGRGTPERVAAATESRDGFDLTPTRYQESARAATGTVIGMVDSTALPALDSTVTMPFFNTGQVVASERLTKRVGLVDVTCSRHPWTHGTIAVFDQPYYSVTDDRGRFSIDSVPAGSYTLMVWRPDLAKPIEHRIDVTAQHTTNVEFGPTETKSLAGQIDTAEFPKGANRSTTIAAKSRAR